MNARERFVTVMSFEKPDRMLHWEMGYWYATLERWYRERLESKHQPPFEQRIFEDTNGHVVFQDEFGVKKR